MKRNYSQVFAICKKIKREYKDVVFEFTNGKHDSLSKLSDRELADLLRLLAQFNTLPPGDPQRKKMIALAKLMRWGNNDDEIKKALNGWLLKQKYTKSLMQLDLQQLGVMVTILETKVYPDYLKALNK